MPWAFEIYIVYGWGATHGNINKQNENKIHTNILFSLGFVEIISLPDRRPQRSLSSESFGKYRQFTQNNSHTNV